VPTRPEVTPRVPGSGQNNLLSYYRAFAWKCQIAAQNAPTKKERDELQKFVVVWREFAAQHEQMITVGDGQVDALICQALWLDMKVFGA